MISCSMNEYLALKIEDTIDSDSEIVSNILFGLRSNSIH